MQGGFDRDCLAGAALVRKLSKKIIADVPLTNLKKPRPGAEPRSTSLVGRTDFIWRDDPDIGRMVNDRLASPLPR